MAWNHTVRQTSTKKASKVESESKPMDIFAKQVISKVFKPQKRDKGKIFHH